MHLAKDQAVDTCETINIGSRIPFTIREFADLIAKKTKSKIIFNPLANFPMSPNPILVPNTDRLERLGWFQNVNISDALDDTINWMKLPTERQQF